MKKGSFFICINHNGEKTAELKTGYIFQTRFNSYGLDKRGGFWYISEIASGLSVYGCGFKTRQNAIDYITPEFDEKIYNILKRDYEKNKSVYAVMENAYKNYEPAPTPERDPNPFKKSDFYIVNREKKAEKTSGYIFEKGGFIFGCRKASNNTWTIFELKSGSPVQTLLKSRKACYDFLTDSILEKISRCLKESLIVNDFKSVIKAAYDADSTLKLPKIYNTIETPENDIETPVKNPELINNEIKTDPVNASTANQAQKVHNSNRKIIRNKTYNNFMHVYKLVLQKGYSKTDAEKITHNIFNQYESNKNGLSVYGYLDLLQPAENLPMQSAEGITEPTHADTLRNTSTGSATAAEPEKPLQTCKTSQNADYRRQTINPLYKKAIKSRLKAIKHSSYTHITLYNKTALKRQITGNKGHIKTPYLSHFLKSEIPGVNSG